MDEHDEVEPSLDMLSQAFAKAMGKQPADGEPGATLEKQARPEASETSDPSPSTPKISPAANVISPKSITEAILFVGHPDNQPITAQTIAALLRGVDADEVKQLVEELNIEYDQQGIPMSIEPTGDGFRLELRSDMEAVQDRFYGRVRHAKLSQLAVDILAVVAYNQPVTREEVEKLLNDAPPAGRVLNQLVRRDLLIRRAAADQPKRKEYHTTDRFLTLFQLSEIGDLPRTEEPP